MTASPTDPTPVWFHPDQLLFKPRYEWALGERIDHPETTARAESIVEALTEDTSFRFAEPEPVSRALLKRTHAGSLLEMLGETAGLGHDVYPTVFPKGPNVRAEPGNPHHWGHWCFDAGTPLNGQAWMAASWSASAALAAAKAVHQGVPLSYSLSRPPGHHATRSRFGGYCYLNNAAIAARWLGRKRKSRVAVLDIDYHHGNGTQSIFWSDPSVLTVSIHADPSTDFPYFAGFRDQIGGGRAEGTNRNLTEGHGCDGARYLQILDEDVAPLLKAFAPEVLILAAGLDTYELDPLGRFKITTEDFRAIGERIGRWGLPVVAVQEGGYHAEHLGRNARSLLHGLRAGLAASEQARA